jgi:pyruvate dehydrogenase E1 component alpha subunit
MKKEKDINIKKKLELFKTMLLIREFENSAVELYARNLIRGSIHLYNGQEAIATGICKNLDIKKGDCIISTHRGHGHIIAIGADPRAMMAELLGKETGLCGGRGGSMHIVDIKVGIYGANGIVSAGIPIACGLAFASVYNNNDFVSVAFFGDGASNEGVLYESLNIASIWNLPVIFVCENNGYAQTTPTKETQSSIKIRSKAEGFGIKNTSVNGNDVEEVYNTARKIIEKVRRTKEPFFLEAITYRTKGHWHGDPEVYRSKEEVEKWTSEKCPIENYENKLIKNYNIDIDKISEIKKQVKIDIEQAIEFAINSKYPDKKTLMDFNYI